ncbi:uncharacterized protein LOC131875358 [Cryptomeria japonica]|uniref:uncharacterized protein LOC131875358 n=1 Tax=Cryptomeria japonica TaxID=3369 RepID=UPI0027DAA4EB|nr:uncharacterized protein LOC131875358 [Cryptomeria japonica]
MLLPQQTHPSKDQEKRKSQKQLRNQVIHHSNTQSILSDDLCNIRSHDSQSVFIQFTIRFHSKCLLAERVSPITQIYRYIQKSLCNVRTNNSQSGVEEAKIEIEQPRKSDEQSAGDQEQRSLSLLISAMLIPNYTPGERKAFSILHTQCTLHRQ